MEQEEAEAGGVGVKGSRDVGGVYGRITLHVGDLSIVAAAVVVESHHLKQGGGGVMGVTQRRKRRRRK